ncbi:MAG: 30S ribosomal protein S20 [Chloroflexi bacterium]|nr:30S ribosomal protein S20 [Chloroflexota bacterium]
MPSKKSQRTAERKALRNRAFRSTVRTTYRAAQRVAGVGAEEDVSSAVRSAVSQLDRAARKGVIHPNNAARHRSQLMRQLNASRATKA